MPGLRAFGRRWEIGSDDFVFPQVTEAIVRFFWFVAMLALYCLHSNAEARQEECTHIQTYILILLIVYSVSILFCFITAYMSSRGTIRNPTPRRNLPVFLYLRCVVVLFEISWNIVGTVWVQNSICPDSQFLTAAKFVVAVEWVSMLSFLLGLWLVFDPLGSLHHQQVNLSSQKARKLWKRRIRLLCLCASRDDQATNAFEEVSQLLGDFFVESDLVPTDVWAGLILIASGEFRTLSQRGKIGSQQLVRPEWMNVVLASRMMEFALGVYGWPYYLWNSMSPTKWIELCRQLKVCTGCRCDQVLVIKDNCCQCNTAALLLQTGLHDADLFHISFHNQIYEVPFIACADPRTSSIVIAIRGSLSLKDVVTDLCVSDESLRVGDCGASSSVNNGGQDVRVHRGILNTAKYVHQTLEGQKIVEDLFVLYPDFDLVITGHSLGGGVAAVVAMMLKPKFPNVRCFAFSPPGCVVSENCVPYTESFICSLVYGDDLVPRLSYHSVRKLKTDIMDAIENCDRAKYEIILKGCYRVLCGTGGISNGHDDLEAPPDPHLDEIEEPLLRRSLSQTSNYTDPAPSENVCSSEVERCRLNIPGTILHLTEDSAGTGRDRIGTFATAWEDGGKFKDIRLSSRMVSDHLPYVVGDALKKVAAQQGTAEGLRF